ncbi:YDG/SRA domain-containing protein [Curtobacterium flaccumfaciens]|uniref:YDG/SRA domain-containing protein n=1 Tax=Curtobacterium poinsettiae TaxID=159612 RepID=A0A9Q9T208_9MICO|nr:YDG/SRA domain-containing protein [Curtobacterium flaccumfaciens]UXN24521.1 YDG/SRA domain-containing protein [Curtobacterium flaccumfaciens]UYC79357.1 YDG/SRA domain-containing protein [Curtobacterium flaccumfaciens pv. poinsettiae]
MVWDIPIGTSIGRRELHNRLGGGSWQDGITRVASTDEMLVFTNDGGGEHGYEVHEGLRSDEVFRYTGQGQSGDQKLTRNNKALADSEELGRSIRVFRGQGTVTYVGSFALADPPYTWERFPGTGSSPERDGLVFNLVAVDADTSLLPALIVEVGAASSRGPETPAPPATTAWQPLDFSEYQVRRVDEGESERSVSRREFELQTRFGEWLRARGEDVQVLRLTEEGVTIVPDLYVPTLNQVVEAKKSTARAYVRTAIGQALDYAAVARRRGLSVTPAVLLPSEPSSSMVELCTSVGITVWWPSSSGDFREIRP